MIVSASGLDALRRKAEIECVGAGQAGAIDDHALDDVVEKTANAGIVRPPAVIAPPALVYPQSGAPLSAFAAGSRRAAMAAQSAVTRVSPG